MFALASLITLPLGLFDMLSGNELLLIFFLVLIFFGGEKMPQFARGLAKALREFKKAASGVEEEFKRAMEDADHTPPTRPPPSTFPAGPAPTILPPNAAPAPASSTPVALNAPESAESPTSAVAGSAPTPETVNPPKGDGLAG